MGDRSSKDAGPHAIDVNLFTRFFAGDDAAFMEIFDRHTHRLYLYCLKYVDDRQAAEDLVQDVWERVMKMRTDGQPAPPVPLALLYRIARNLSLNHIRNRRNLTGLDDLSESQAPTVTQRERSHREELVTLALSRLPIPYREVLILNAYSDYRFDEIAEMLNEPVGAVRTRAWRARTKLGRIIAALIGAEGTDEGLESNDRLDDEGEQLEDEQ